MSSLFTNTNSLWESRYEWVIVLQTFTTRKHLLVTVFIEKNCLNVLVTGSEDQTVYFFNIDEPNKPLNTLLGHSSPVVDVCWNYDESLLASCDLEV